jgi:competence protein ComEC
MRSKAGKYLLTAVLALSVVFLIWSYAGNRELTVYFLDVGQGDSAFIRFPSGKSILIDGGESEGRDSAVMSFLRKKGVRKIDAVILSHAHSDHAGGLLRVLEDIPVGIFIEPGAAHTSDIYINLLDLAAAKNIPYLNVSRGDVLKGFGEAEIIFLNPPESFYRDESPLNNNSIVMRLEYGVVSFLFTGDIEKKAEEELVAVYGDSLASVVLKAPHHGSGSSNTAGFISAVGPAVAVISAGIGNDFGHPHRSVLKRYGDAGIKILRTDENGTVVIKTDGKRLSVGS